MCFKCVDIINKMKNMSNNCNSHLRPQHTFPYSYSHVVTEEDEVSLVMEGTHPPPFVLWGMMKDGSQHAPHHAAQLGSEVV